jgi:formate C-acetyltransferase
MNNRVANIRRQVMDSIPSVDILRGRVYTKIHKGLNALPLVTRNALAFRELYETMPIIIHDGELIVGSPTIRRRAAQVFPEVQSGWLGHELDGLCTREWDPLELSVEDKNVLKEEILPFWRGKTINERVFLQLDRETKSFLYRDPDEYPTKPSCLIDNFSLLEKGIGTTVPNYKAILENGVDVLAARAEQERKKLDPTAPENIDRIIFLEAVETTLNAFVTLALRYSELALSMASVERNLERKDELIEIARICKKVPALPPDTFHEAIQAFWFTHMAVRVELSGHSISPGRFDQYMWPFYKNDSTLGMDKKGKATELLELLYLKFSELMLLVSTPTSRHYAGVPQWQNLNVGGRKPDGEDATNDLSYLCIEAMANLKIVQPDISIRVHRHTPEKLLLAACKLSRLGTGHPKFYNDELITLSMVSRGLSIEEARDFSIMGCVEPRALGEGIHITGGHVNVPTALELALNNGVYPLTGMQLGPMTGVSSEFDTFEKLWEAVEIQLDNMIRHLFIVDAYAERAYVDIISTPFLSAITPDCIKTGKSLQAGGARYNFGPAVNLFGVPDVGDSLYAIKKVVYEKKIISLNELIGILNDDFTGHEELRQYLLNKVDKYGNDIDEVDNFVREVAQMGNAFVMKYHNIFGGQADGGIIPVTSGIAFGSVTGALPSGRKKGAAYADGASPMPGLDMNGPTASLKSVGKMDLCRLKNGTLLNIKINPSTVKDDVGLKKFADLIRGAFDSGVWHLQVNCVTAEILRDAQARPTEHRDLLVRVAGYSAYFANLHDEVQEDIIKRTEFSEL